MKGLIISSGTINDYNLLNSLIEENDYIVCADGGLDHILKIGQIPNLLLGDLDSISDFGIQFIKNNNIPVEKFPSVKNNTDTELAIMYLRNMGVDDITLIGGTGSRLDHSLANIFLLKKFNEKGRKLRILDDNNIINYVVDSIEIKKNQDRFVSIIPLNDSGLIVSLKGFEYPLDHEYIDFASTLGISNRIVEEIGIIKIHEGEALVFESLD